MSQTKRSIRVIASKVDVAQLRPRSCSTPAAWASALISSCNLSLRLGSSPSALENSSKRFSSLASLFGVALFLSAGGIWPSVIAPTRLLAWAASPGSLTMKG